MLGESSTSQQVAIFIILAVVGLAFLAGIAYLVVATIRNVIVEVVGENWPGWAGAWLALTVVTTLVAAAIAPEFSVALRYGLLIPTIALVGVVVLLGLFVTLEDMYEEFFD